MFRFTQEKKKTTIVKTDDPAPNSYQMPYSVGVIANWNDFEANPRPIIESTKKERAE